MEVISNVVLNDKFRKIKEYKIDLGLALKMESKGKGQDKSSKWVMKDNVVKKYYELVDRYIIKTGRIGTLSFYVDNKLDSNVIFVMNDNNLYQLSIDINGDIRIQLSDLLSKVLDGKITTYELISDVEIKEPDLKNMSTEELMKYLRNNR